MHLSLAMLLKLVLAAPKTSRAQECASQEGASGVESTCTERHGGAKNRFNNHAEALMPKMFSSWVKQMGGAHAGKMLACVEQCCDTSQLQHVNEDVHKPCKRPSRPCRAQCAYYMCLSARLRELSCPDCSDMKQAQ